MKNVSDERVAEFAKAYWKGERFFVFGSGKWLPETDESYRYFQNSHMPEGTVSLTYYDPGSRMLPLPASADKISLARSSRFAGFAQRASDPTVHRTLEPMGSAFEVSVAFSKNPKTVAALSGSSLEIPHEAAELFASYWSSIPKDVSADPLKLAKHVREGSGFGYSTEAPAKNLRSFLYEERRGHCEYFATVLALTMRRFGYPATVVNGYYS